ncbi:MAG: hypothetical protein WBP93_02595 [Pyrinomonadaceae bacterium]
MLYTEFSGSTEGRKAIVQLDPDHPALKTGRVISIVEVTDKQVDFNQL